MSYQYKMSLDSGGTLQTNNYAFIEHMQNYEISARKKLSKWIDELREKGYKAAHPNDGWVDREKKEIHFLYPQFNDGVKIGSKVMLGWDDNSHLRPIEIIGKRESLLGMIWWKFEDLKELTK